jgi:hypothetical protein
LRGRHDRACLRDPWRWFAPTARWICFVFYAFAAFAKLNSGFLDHQHFYDFTTVLFALFGLFLPDTDTAELHRRVDGSPCSPLAQLQAC